MIFKIQPDIRHYQQFALSIDDVEEKLGEDCLIAMDSRPISYGGQWQAVEGELFDEFPDGSSKKAKPDVMVDNLGHLYFSNKAYLACATLLNDCGEWLPISIEGNKAYLFNPLTKAEELNAVDAANTQYGEWDALKRVAFHEDKLNTGLLVKTELDSYRGVYCLCDFKDAIETAGLNGLIFNEDLSDLPAGMN